MKEYIELLANIRDNGFGKDDRTGVGSRSIVGAQMRSDLSKRFPIPLTRRVAPRIAFEELMFMLNGKSQTKELEDKNINIWKGNTSKEFQKKMDLDYLDEGDFGRMYGVQMRDYKGIQINDDTLQPELLMFDQLRYALNILRSDPLSRRIIISQYNPAEANQGVLFPCHIMIQFIVTGNKLNCVYWMRSSDTVYGLPYNHMYYAFFTHMMAMLTGFEVGDLVYQAGDSHFYNNQIDMVNELIDVRYPEIYAFEGMIGMDMKLTERENPQVEFRKPIETLNDMLTYSWDDVNILNYDPLKDFTNKPPMAI